MSVTVTGPINYAQLGDALPNGWTCTDNGNGTFTIASTAYTDTQIQTAYGGIVYDANYQQPPVANAATLRQRAQNALTTNANYLAITGPTNAQVVAQVQALTKECNGIIRLLLGLLDSTAGT